MVKIILIILFLLLILFVGPQIINSQTRPSEPSNPARMNASEAEVLRLEELGRQRILNGDTKWDDMMADGAYIIQYDGSVMTYQAGSTLPASALKSFILTDLIARAVGDAVVVTGLGEMDGVMPDKRSYTVKVRFTNVWQKKKSGKGWEIVVSEHTTVKDSFKITG